MSQITRLRDIPQLTRGAAYRINVSWRYLEKELSNLEEMGLDLDPDFQRAHVWDETKRRRYVEYVLRGGKSSRDLQLNHTRWDNSTEEDPGVFTLVDGKQRLESVRMFLANELSVFGSLRNEFQDRLSHLDADFVFNVHNLPTRAKVLQWYLDLNEGGVIHTDEELAKVRALLAQEAPQS